MGHSRFDGGLWSFPEVCKGLGSTVLAVITIVGGHHVSWAEDRDRVVVNSTAELRNNIGRSGIELVLAPYSTDTYGDPIFNGRYVLLPCPGGEEQERGDTPCGQLEQGDDSVLRSDLYLPLGKRGVPIGRASGGAVVDCSLLPPSALEFSCIVAGAGSTISRLTVVNGRTRPDPDPPGGDPMGPDNRNGIMVPAAGTKAVIDRVRILNTRRGVAVTTESDLQTRAVIRHSLIDGTELAGIFLGVIAPDFSGTSDAGLIGDVYANRLSRVGLHPILFEWAFFGHGNNSEVSITGNLVDSTNVRGISVVAGGFQDEPATENTGLFDITDNHLEGEVGLSMFVFGQGNSDNCLAGRVDGLSIKGGVPAIDVFFVGWGVHNRFLVEMTNGIYVPTLDAFLAEWDIDSRYLSGMANGNFVRKARNITKGKVVVKDDPNNDFRFAGSPGEFLRYNWNFTLSDVDRLLDFSRSDFREGFCG